MNPQIRYPEHSQSNGIKFSYDRLQTIDRAPPSRHNDSSNHSQPPQHQHPPQPLLHKHKSNNTHTQFYQQANFTQSYPLESRPFSPLHNDHTSYQPQTFNQQNLTYKSTNYSYQRQQTSKFESANDFFTVAAESIKNQDKNKNPLIHTQHLNNHIQQIHHKTQNITHSHHLYSQQPHQNHKTDQPKSQNCQLSSSDDCLKCQQLQQQNQRIIAFMRQQLEIGVKQFTHRINKIIIEQANEIKDLRKSLINNQKILINFNKNPPNPSNFQPQPTISPAKNVQKQRSPSKLSLTKSNTSLSTNNPNRQKITMVSKELSPSKSSINQNFRRPEKQQMISLQKQYGTVQTINQSQFTHEELQRKIKSLEEHIQALCKMEHERNEKALLMNKKIEILEKGVISFFGSRTQMLRNFLSQSINQQEERLKELYQEMKVISSRVGSMAGNSSNPSVKQISSSSLKQTQNSSYSTASIIVVTQSKDQCGEFNLNKASLKLKHLSSEMEDLKELAANLHSKEYKYDNFQIESLKKVISEVRLQMRNLEKSRVEISGKLIENEERVGKAIEMSKFGGMGSEREIFPFPTSSDNQYTNDKMKKVSKTNITRNNSMQISYSQKNFMNETGYRIGEGTKSIKSELPGRSQTPVREQSILPRFMNVMGKKNNSVFEGCSHSEFNGFAGEESGFSQYAEESVYDGMGNNGYRGQQQNDEESFQRSSEDEDHEDHEEEEEDEFFYKVDLSTQDHASRYSRNNQRQPSRNNNHYSQNNQTQQQKNNNQIHRDSHQLLPSSTISRFMQVIQHRQNKPLRIQIDQTGYIKSADNGMYIVDRNMDGFDLSRHELDWLSTNGIVILQK